MHMDASGCSRCRVRLEDEQGMVVGRVRFKDILSVGFVNLFQKNNKKIRKVRGFWSFDIIGLFGLFDFFEKFEKGPFKIRSSIMLSVQRRVKRRRVKIEGEERQVVIVVPPPRKRTRYGVNNVPIYSTNYKHRFLAHLDTKVPNSFWLGKVIKESKHAIHVEYYSYCKDGTFKPAWVMNDGKLYSHHNQPFNSSAWSGVVLRKGGGIISSNIHLDPSGSINRKSKRYITNLTPIASPSQH